MTSARNYQAHEKELNEIIKEYFETTGYIKTQITFSEECEERGIAIPSKNRPKRTLSAAMNAQREMFEYFKKGDMKYFFQIWDDALSEKTRNEDSVAQKLEFYLHLYFAIFPLKQQPDEKVICEEAMLEFRKYLENRGAKLSQTTEFLPFYALPYVSNPKTHPSFKDIFSEHWVPDLESRLLRFLQLTLETNKQPRLLELFLGVGQTDALQMQKMQSQIVEAERRTMQYMRRHNRVQADYHNLIGVTAELVDTLESCLRGKSVSSDYLQQICSKLFASHQIKQSVDLSRPGSAAHALRQSIKPSNNNGFGSNGIAPARKSDPEAMVELDYDKVKHDLQFANDRRKAFLYQALQWRLTKVENTEIREKHLSEYLANDLLGITENGSYKTAILSTFSASDEILRQYAARLLNTIASFSRGRTYLTQSTDVLTTLFSALKNEDKKTLTSDNIMGVLQKLSLRRPMQSAMIAFGMIEWTIDLLANIDSLSDYCLEYAVALVLNLCLRTSGKYRCVESSQKTLRVLSALLSHDNKEIIPYVNGALYSILAIPAIREEANRMNMNATLQSYIQEDQADMNRQLDFIIKQLNSTDEPDSTDSDAEEEDDEDDTLEPDLDRAEQLRATSPGELFGEQLLVNVYKKQDSKTTRSYASRLSTVRDEEKPISRPVTPGNRSTRVAQSQPMDRERPTSGRASVSQEKNSRRGSSMSKSQGDGTSRPKVSEYKEAFSSKPKIPRTPDTGTLGTRRSGPKPTYSDQMPESRPYSGGQV